MLNVGDYVGQINKDSSGVWKLYKDKINKKASLELQQQIENAEIAIIENAGHEVNTDNPTLLGQKLNGSFKQYV